jgi:hypothetical protein
MKLLNNYIGWRQSWTIIVPGKFNAASDYTDLLFYDPTARTGEFYSTYLGNITLLQSNRDWRPSWNIIVPGIFSGSPWTGLLFYDQGAGVGEFYATDGTGKLSPVLTSYGDWRTTWTHIVPGSLGGPQTDLLFYDAVSGDLELYQVQGGGNLTDGRGNYAPWRSYPDWSAGYTHVIPGKFGGGSYTNFLFYNAATGQASFYNSDGAGNLVPMTELAWNTGQTQVVPGMFGGIETDFLFYDAAANSVSVLLESGGEVYPLNAGELPFGVWTIIVPGSYSDSGYTDLLFYDVGSGIGSFYSSETPVDWGTGLVQGYVGATSVFPGDILPFHVSTSTGNFTLDIYRSTDLETTLRVIENSIRRNIGRWLRGRNQETCQAAAGNR